MFKNYCKLNIFRRHSLLRKTERYKVKDFRSVYEFEEKISGKIRQFADTAGVRCQ